MDDRTNLSGVLDAHYAEFARSIGVSVKQLRAWTAKTKFDAEFLARFGRRVSCTAVAAFCEPVIKRFGELPTEGAARQVAAGEGIRTVVPQRLSPLEPGKMSVRFYFRAAKPMGASLLQFWADGVLAFERKLRVVKPSEMIVADIPVRKIGDAQRLEFRVVPAPEKAETEDEIEEEA